MNEKKHVTNEQIGIFFSVVLIAFVFLYGISRALNLQYAVYISWFLLAVSILSETAAIVSERREHHKAVAQLAFGFGIAAMVCIGDEVENMITAYLQGGPESAFSEYSHVVFFFYAATFIATGVIVHPHSAAGVVRKVLMYVTALPMLVLYLISVMPFPSARYQLIETICQYVFLALLLTVTSLNLLHFIKLENAMHEDKEEVHLSRKRILEARRALKSRTEK